MTRKRLLIDGREFVINRNTGIGRFLEGFLAALADAALNVEIILAVYGEECVPSQLQNRANLVIQKIPSGFLASEMALARLSRDRMDVFLSPYPKIPLFPIQCPIIHTIHDIFYLTHPAYIKRFKVHFDRFRLQKALQKASLTWYDSAWSLEETKKYTGFAGKNPRVRFLAIDGNFSPAAEVDRQVLNKYGLSPGYILSIGNGMPHKNLGVLLELSGRLSRQLVLAGVPPEKQLYWQAAYPGNQGKWLNYLPDEDLRVLVKGAFCLAQPSTAEGYGYPPLEAMASGRPAVISNIPVLVETTGNNALIADPYKAESWQQAFQSLEDADFYDSQIQKGLAWVEPLLSGRGWQSHINDLQQFIDGGGQ